MEHNSTRTPRRTAAPQPRPAPDDTAGAKGGKGGVRPGRPPGQRGGPPLARLGALGRGRLGALRQGPAPRLTGFGAGLLTSLAMLTIGCLDELLFSGSPAVYGVLFLLASAACGLWVRPLDLIMAPISVPIAFVAGLVPINDGDAGFAGQTVGVFTSLSLHAGWLYAGTMLSSVIVIVRGAAQVNRRRRRQLQRQRPSPPPRSPRC